MPIEEKSWKEIEQEYAQARKEKQSRAGDSGRWGKCPACEGTGKTTCPSCKGLGRDLSSNRRSEACPTCRGTGKANCSHAGCQGGWVKVSEKQT
jgi:hypothetical protein